MSLLNNLMVTCGLALCLGVNANAQTPKTLKAKSKAQVRTEKTQAGADSLVLEHCVIKPLKSDEPAELGSAQLLTAFFVGNKMYVDPVGYTKIKQQPLLQKNISDGFAKVMADTTNKDPMGHANCYKLGQAYSFHAETYKALPRVSPDSVKNKLCLALWDMVKFNDTTDDMIADKKPFVNRTLDVAQPLAGSPAKAGPKPAPGSSH